MGFRRVSQANMWTCKVTAFMPSPLFEQIRACGLGYTMDQVDSKGDQAVFLGLIFWRGCIAGLYLDATTWSTVVVSSNFRALQNGQTINPPRLLENSDSGALVGLRALQSSLPLPLERRPAEFAGQRQLEVPPCVEDLAQLISQGNQTIIRLLRDIAIRLACCHERGFPYSKLQMNNITLQNGRASLVDMGQHRVPTVPDGPMGYMAPELLGPDNEESNPLATYETDMYAFGSLCFEIYSGQPPFASLSMWKIMTKIMAGEHPSRPTGDTNIPPGLWVCVLACWNVTPSTRPNAKQVVAFLSHLLEDLNTLPIFQPHETSVGQTSAE